MRLKAKAAAAILKTEESRALFNPIEKVIDKPKSNKRIPLSLANSAVLKPRIKQIEKTISARVATTVRPGIKASGH
ncbi:MAG: hypothetical protein WBN69_02125 [Eudoraea sp.]